MFVVFTKREGLRHPSAEVQLLAVRADAVLAVVAGSQNGAALYLRDRDHSAPLGVAEDVPTVLAKLQRALTGGKDDGSKNAD